TVLSSGDKAVNQLKDHADNLLIIRGINYPQTSPAGCGHAEGLSQSLTARTPNGRGSTARASGPSVDVVISQAVNPQGTDPLTLYAGNLNNGYIEERISFDNNGNVRAATDNPYKLYQSLVGVVTPGNGSTGGNGAGSAPPSMTDELLRRRKSANDQVRAELNSLLQNPKLSAEDKQRLQQHFDAIREVEIKMTDPTNPIAGCSTDGLDVAGIEALKSYRYNKTNVPNGGMENIVELHMQLVALA